jgi:hypothetical protein
LYKEFDGGYLRFDAPKAADEVINTLAILDDTQPPLSAEENSTVMHSKLCGSNSKK